jgi:hypothetical protein
MWPLFFAIKFVDTALLSYHPDKEWYPEAPRGGAGSENSLREDSPLSMLKAAECPKTASPRDLRNTWIVLVNSMLIGT